MDELYVENFFQRNSQTSPTELVTHARDPEVNEESINQIHFHFRVLKEEVGKHLKETPPFPLMLGKLETAIFSQNRADACALLDDLEEFLDLQYLPNA